MGCNEDLFLTLHYASILLAVVVPLYYWFVRKERTSMVLKVARGVRVVNAILYVAAFFFVLELFWNDIELGLPLLIALPVISYLLAKRWGPKTQLV